MIIMQYDEASFLSGVAVGRNMKSWPSFAIGGRVWAFTVELIEENLSFTLPIRYVTPEDIDITISWGDGTVSQITSRNIGGVNHQYGEAGTYTVVAFGLPNEAMMLLTGASAKFQASLIRLHSPILPTGDSGSVNRFTSTYDYSTESIFGHKIPVIDKKLLDYYRDRTGNVLDLVSMFSPCYALTEVPDSLFDGIGFSLSNGSVNSMFRNCRALGSVGSIFNNPAFADVTNAGYVFYNCELLSEIPGDLFSQMAGLQVVGYAFSKTSLSSIPEDLFSYSHDLYSFQYTFWDCLNLRSIPESLFDNIVDSEDLNFRSCFSGCSGITGAVPELWNKFPLCTKSEGCFSGCINASNYDDIPIRWGGPKGDEMP